MATTAANMEREIKLGADWALDLPDLRPIVGRTTRRPDQDLRTAYFDTRDLRLWRRGMTLRHRTEGDDAATGIWTLKLPGEGTGSALQRTELSWPGEAGAVPGEALRLLTAIIRRAPLEQVAELATTRHRLLLGDPDGDSLVELDDDVVTIMGGGRDGIRFRQIELELSGSDAGVLGAVVEELHRAGAFPDNEPKLAKAIETGSAGREANAEAYERFPDPLSSVSSLSDVVRSSIAAGLDRLLDHDLRLRVSPSEPAVRDVHQARVATRRLRSDLKTLAELLDPVWLRHTRDDLGWVGSALGRVRDIDVLAESLLRDGEDPSPGASAFRDQCQNNLVAERLAAAGDLAQVLADHDRYLNLLDRLHAATLHPPFLEGDAGQAEGPMVRGVGPSGYSPSDIRAVEALPAVVGAQWRSLRKRVRKAGRRPSDRDLHRIRIRAKQLRYAAEAAAPVMGKRATRLASGAQRVQTTLGEHHDLVEAEHELTSLAQGLSPMAAFAAGELSSRVRARREILRKEWKREWQGLRRKKLRRWLA